MKGGHANSGPAPDPFAARRERPSDSAGWTTLPAAGRLDPAPEWPLRPKASPRELELWAREWKRPQAIMWERNGQEAEVALYVRRLSEAEQYEVPTNLLTWIKQMQEALGISLPGMLRLRWKISEATGPQVSSPREGNVVSAKERFRKQ